MLKIYSLDDCPIKHLIPLLKSPTKGISLVSLNKKNVVRFLWRLYFHIDGTNELSNLHIHRKLKNKLDRSDKQFSDRYIQRCLFIYANTFKIEKAWTWVQDDDEYSIDLYERNGFKKKIFDHAKEKRIRKNNLDIEPEIKIIKYEIDLIYLH